MYEELRGKRLLFVGAMVTLCEIVETAKSMGIYTIVADYNIDSPAKKHADKSLLIDISDADAIIKACIDEKVDGIFVISLEFALPVCRKVADTLNIPFYASHDQIRLSLDKSFFKETCRKYGVPVPKDYLETYLTTPSDIDFPVIIKPVDCAAGKGIKICYDLNELNSAYEEALAASPSKTVLIEQYLAGDEFTLTYTLKDGEVSFSMMKDKLLSEDHENITSQSDLFVIPSKYTQLCVDTVADKLKNLLIGMKATSGSIFFQGIVENGKMYVFECGYRPSGGCDWRAISDVNGINFVKIMIEHALTGKGGHEDLSLDNPFFSKYVVVYTLWSHGGTIGAMSGLEDVLALDNVKEAEFRRRPGDTIKEDNTLKQMVFRANIVDSSIERVKDTILFIQKNIKVQDKFGKSMLYSNFDLNRLNEYRDV